jgi:hypothetical protein
LTFFWRFIGAGALCCAHNIKSKGCKEGNLIKRLVAMTPLAGCRLLGARQRPSFVKEKDK